MTSRTLARKFLPEFSTLMTDFPSWTGLRPVFGTHGILLEEEIQDGCYTVRAEIPGIDIDKDLDIIIRSGHLTIKAERSEKTETQGRSEFSYGSFTRTVLLPVGADADAATATYDKGILSVSIPVTEAAESEKHVSVRQAG